MEHKKFVWAGSLMTVSKELSKYDRFSWSARGQKGEWWYRTNRKMHSFMEIGTRIMN
jgi:hypothetical protein